MTGKQPNDTGGIPTIDPGPLHSQNDQQLWTTVPGDDVTDEQLRADGTNPEGWLHYNKGPGMQGFSPARRLRPDTVDTLEEQYTLELPSTVFQCNPIVVPDDPPVMYHALGNMSVYATNARTGEHYWRFDYSLEHTDGTSGRTRGVAVWEDKLYLAASDLRLVALNRYDGRFQWKTWLLSERQRRIMDQPTKMGQSEAPVAYDGTILIGQSGGNGSWGAVLGVDAETGDIRWDNDICLPENWVGKSWRYGDGAAWMSPAVDVESGVAFYPTGNPGVRYNGTVRPGPNRDTDSVIAVDVETGEKVWAYQLLAQDWFDWDTSTTPRVFDLVVDGEQRRVLAIEDKSGWSHIIDAETGQLVERTEPYAKQGGDETDDHEFLSILKAYPWNAEFNWPADEGGTNWSPDAYSPQTGLLYIGGNDFGAERFWEPGVEYDPDRMDIDHGGGRGRVSDHRKSRVVALDPADAGRVVWSREYDVTPGTRIQAGGITATGGGLLFTSLDETKLVALDAASGGEPLWEDDLGALVESSPVVWDDPDEERQYVAVSYDEDGDGSRTGRGRIRVYASEPGIESRTPTPTATRTESPTASPSRRDTGTEEDSQGDGNIVNVPGFGVLETLGGLGAAAWWRKRFGSTDDEDD